jgi:predicted dehydrogenase
MHTYSREIDKLIADMHPRHRRLRQAEKALKESIDKGKILDPQDIPHKIEQYFEKNWKPEEPEIKPKPKILTTSHVFDLLIYALKFHVAHFR